MYMINFLFEITILLLYIIYIIQVAGLVVGLLMDQINDRKTVKYLLIPLGFILYIMDKYRDMDE